jgi:hypothetical protein
LHTLQNTTVKTYRNGLKSALKWNEFNITWDLLQKPVFVISSKIRCINNEILSLKK